MRTTFTTIKDFKIPKNKVVQFKICTQNFGFPPELLSILGFVLVDLALLGARQLARQSSITLIVSMPPAKQSKPFNPAHAKEFGLMIMEKDLITGAVLSVRCQFCVYFDRENRNSELIRKRAKTTSIMHWSGSFRSDLYRKHHEQQHCNIWKAYQLSSSDEKHSFFNNRKPFRENNSSSF